MVTPIHRLLVVSNRAPYSIRRRGRRVDLVPTVGGLATTLDDLLRRRGGTWLAWSGTTARRGQRRGRSGGSFRIRSSAAPGAGYRVRLLNLTETDVADYYQGFSNRSLWPLCHLLIGQAHFDSRQWKVYEAVNRMFARAAARFVPSHGIAWVHDYHLALVPSMLRAQRPQSHIATFWHIPFPPPAVFRVHPHAAELIAGLLGSDLIGFHTPEYARHFLECAEALVGAEVDLNSFEAHYHHRSIRVGSFPLGVEARTFGRLGSDRRVLLAVDKLRAAVGTEKILLGVDRLDYTKGILERLQAYERLLAENPDLHRKVCFVQIQVPSREVVPEYRTLREQIDRTVGRICGRFSSVGWVPVRYLYQSFSRRELISYYRAADVLVVTPLRDGMNLVAQEYVATRADEDGVLVLSRFAGAAERLREAVLVNPYDRMSLVAALERAIRMKHRERQAAMRAMRERVAAEDVNWWVGWFLAAAVEERGRVRRARKSA